MAYDLEIMNMATARSRGLKVYFLGTKCKNGNVANRRLVNSQCMCDDCKEERKEKQREKNKNPSQKKKAADYYQRVKDSTREARKTYKARGDVREREKEMKKRRRSNKRLKDGLPPARESIPQNIIPDGEKITAKEYARAYYLKNKERNIEAANEWARNNREKRREVSTRWNRKSRKDNPHISFARKTLSRMGYIGSKTAATRLLGYSHEDFIERIESQFSIGMSWGNRGEWHVDHIKPIAAFNKEGVKDIKIINALSNLQPLWAKDNLSKGAKY